jgi:hypothetical protein
VKVYKRHDVETLIRSHPWQGNSNERYYDFKVQPDLVTTVLEDFTPWSDWAAIQAFFKLVVWLNSPASELESNDCAFGGIYENVNPDFQKSLQCHGRIMLFYRYLELNSAPENINWLEDALNYYLNQLQPDLEFGAIGTSQLPVRYLELETDGNQANGKQLILSFWCWGDSHPEIMGNLDLLIQALFQAVQGVSMEVAKCYELSN